MENRRLLLAVFLSALILIIWNSIFPPVPPTAPPPGPVSDQGLEERGPADAPRPEGSTAAVATGTDSEDELTEPEEQNLIEFGETTVAEIDERVVIENDKVRLEFTNRGAQLTSFRLLDYQAVEGEGLEMVRSRGSDPYPFALVVGGKSSHRLNNALFVWEREEDDNGDPVVRFQHRSGRGSAEKVFRLTQEGLIEVELTVLGDRDWSVVLGPGLRNLSEKEAGNSFIQRDVGYQRGDALETVDRTKQEADEYIPGLGLRWATLEDNFFLVAVMPRRGVQEIVVRPIFQRGDYEEGQPRFLPIETQAEAEGLAREQLLLLEASGQEMEIEALFGAKRYSELVALPYGLEKTVRWGWFGFLAKPLYYALEWIYHNMVANYGWAIVLVTCLIRILFFPLTHKSQESMAKMQALNPKVQAIRNRYRSKLKDKQGRPNVDAQRQMNEEVMKVYKTAGVNPASGCLPVLLQAPVFFAFFRLLSTAVELRNAPWIGWVNDLSVPDPIYVLPILMGITSVALQRMMPAAPDPMQRRMMQALPIVFTFFAFAFPSGLVLYWVTNNLLSMLQQAITTKLKKRREAMA